MVEKLRVLIVARHFPLSREQVLYSFVYDEVTRLAEELKELHVVKGEYGKDSKVNGTYVHHLRRMNSSIIPFLTRRIFDFPSSSVFHPLESYYYCANYGQTVASLASEKKIDLLHAHFACPEGFVAKLASQSVHKPLVVTLHGSDILTESSIGYGDRLRNDYNNMVRRVFASADKVLAASRAVYDEALRIGCDRSKLEFLPNGVDLKRFSLEKPDCRDSAENFRAGNNPVVLTVRALVPKNGVEYLIRAAPMVLEHFPKAMFLIAGKGPLRSYLECLSTNLGLSKSIIFCGEISYEDLPRYYAACDVFVIPSIVEAFGLVTVEAMASGKPVIGANVGGIADTIEDGRNGFLVSAKGPQSLAQKIVLLLENPDLRQKMGIEGRRMAEERFDIKRRIHRILEIYSELV